MSRSNMHTVAARASRSIDTTAEPKISDGELLSYFIQAKDETAFTELVRRLGPMVLGVCRRITGNHDFAEDAFQAAFIVLARRANDVRPKESVRGWLYGIAVRTAKKARALSIHRRALEVNVPSLPDRPAELAEPPDTDALRFLDEEVGALPDYLRVTVVLCELEGQCRKDVAQKLRIPVGTLSSRLATARKRLAERLRQRGIVLSAAGLSVALTQLASAQPSSALIASATAAVTGETIPVHVANLSHGVLRIMFLNKLKTTIPLTLLVAGLLACVTIAAMPSQIPSTSPLAHATKPVLFLTVDTDPPPAKVDPKTLPKGPNKLLFYRAGYLAMIDPDGKNEKKVSEELSNNISGMDPIRVSPDGKKVAVLIRTEMPSLENPNPPHKLFVRELTEMGPGTDLGITCKTFAWSPDSTKIATSDYVDGPGPAPAQKLGATHYIINVSSKEKTEIGLPADHFITDWSQSGKYLLTTLLVNDENNPSARIHLMNLDGTQHKALTGEKELAMVGLLSPDGSRVLYLGIEVVKEKPSRRELCVVETTTGKKTVVADQPLNGEYLGFCWSPDGKRIAYTWREVHEGKPEDVINKETESHLVVCDPDGKNQQTIVSEKGQGRWNVTIGTVDWR
jgi:RNA polymerase sigma factor (sigma-70 family)